MTRLIEHTSPSPEWLAGLQRAIVMVHLDGSAPAHKARTMLEATIAEWERDDIEVFELDSTIEASHDAVGRVCRGHGDTVWVRDGVVVGFHRLIELNAEEFLRRTDRYLPPVKGTEGRPRRWRIGEGVSLRRHLEDCNAGRVEANWMISSEDRYSMDMVLLPVYLDEGEMEPEEYEAIEDEVLRSGPGYGICLNEDQLVDIVDNLTMQKPDFTEEEQEKAINHYAERDAFLVVKVTGGKRARPGAELQIVTLPDDLELPQVIQAVRGSCGLSLGDVKRALDRCRAGDPPRLRAATPQAAAELVAALGALGCDVRQLEEEP